MPAPRHASSQISLVSRRKGRFANRRSVDFWYRRISLSALVPGRHRRLAGLVAAGAAAAAGAGFAICFFTKPFLAPALAACGICIICVPPPNCRFGVCRTRALVEPNRSLEPSTQIQIVLDSLGFDDSNRSFEPIKTNYISFCRQRTERDVSPIRKEDLEFLHTMSTIDLSTTTVASKTSTTTSSTTSTTTSTTTSPSASPRVTRSMTSIKPKFPTTCQTESVRAVKAGNLQNVISAIPQLRERRAASPVPSAERRATRQQESQRFKEIEAHEQRPLTPSLPKTFDILKEAVKETGHSREQVLSAQRAGECVDLELSLIAAQLGDPAETLSSAAKRVQLADFSTENMVITV